LLRGERFQRLDRGLERAGLEIQFGEPERGRREGWVDGRRFPQSHASLTVVSDLQLGQSELVVRRGESRLQPQDALEILDGLGYAPLSQIHPPPEELSLEARGVLSQDDLQGLVALFVRALTEGELGEATPGLPMVRNLLGDFAEKALGLLRPPHS